MINLMSIYLTVLQELTEAPQQLPFAPLKHQLPPDQRRLLMFPAILLTGGIQPFLSDTTNTKNIQKFTL